MTPVERLQAAIETLERAKEQTTPGPWTHLYGPEYSTIEYELERGVRPVALVGRSSDDAELIVTLHRTIDAQLAILRDAVVRVRNVYLPDTEIVGSIVALADAILGSDQ